MEVNISVVHCSLYLSTQFNQVQQQLVHDSSSLVSAVPAPAQTDRSRAWSTTKRNHPQHKNVLGFHCFDLLYVLRPASFPGTGRPTATACFFFFLQKWPAIATFRSRRRSKCEPLFIFWADGWMDGCLVLTWDRIPVLPVASETTSPHIVLRSHLDNSNYSLWTPFEKRWHWRRHARVPFENNAASDNYVTVFPGSAGKNWLVTNTGSLFWLAVLAQLTRFFFVFCFFKILLTMH